VAADPRDVLELRDQGETLHAALAAFSSSMQSGRRTRPWMWASGHSADSVGRAAHGYEPTRGGDGGVREELAEGGKDWANLKQ
jgi:hypothetical protein